MNSNNKETTIPKNAIENTAAGRISFQNKVKIAKDSLALFRELIIVIAAIVIAVYPPILLWWAESFNKSNDRKNASISEINLGFAKITLENDAQRVVSLENAKKNNEVIQRRAETLINTGNPVQKQVAQQIKQDAEKVAGELQANISSIKTQQLEADQRIQNAQSQATGSGTYAIVVSADKQDDLAEYEVKQLTKRKLDVAVYERQGFLRTVARFPAKDAAEAQLGSIQGYRSTAYVINLDKWCPSPIAEERTIDGMRVFRCP